MADTLKVGDVVMYRPKKYGDLWEVKAVKTLPNGRQVVDLKSPTQWRYAVPAEKLQAAW